MTKREILEFFARRNNFPAEITSSHRTRCGGNYSARLIDGPSTPSSNGPRIENGRGERICTSDPLRPRQVRYQAALRPDSSASLILNHFKQQEHGALPSFGASSAKTVSHWAKTHQLILAVSKLTFCSVACRFSLNKAPRFICEYFLKTLASPCLNSCVTHSSATPLALSRVA